MNEIIAEPIIEPQQQAEPVAQEKTAPKKRHVLLRLFAIKLTGWIRLILLCILVGFLVMAAEFDPQETAEFSAVKAVGDFTKSALEVLGWAVTHFWKPALAGATIVMPIWVLWRMVTLPFRK